jgi:hypothetical protein
MNQNTAAVVHVKGFFYLTNVSKIRVNAAINSVACHMANGQVVQVHIYQINEKSGILTQKTNTSNRLRCLNKCCQTINTVRTIYISMATATSYLNCKRILELPLQINN